MAKKRKVNRHAKKRNAVHGARVTWCPKCERKAALGRRIMGFSFTRREVLDAGRTCRYCGYVDKQKDSDRLKELERWEAAKAQEAG